MASSQPSGTGSADQFGVAYAMDSQYLDKLLAPQPTAPAPTVAEIASPTTAMSNAWKKRVKDLRDWERELFESNANFDVESYTQKTTEFAEEFQADSLSFKVVKLIEPLFQVLRLYTPHAANAAQAYPSPASAVLGGLMCVMQVSANYSQYQERIMHMMARMGEKAAILVQYDREIYQHDEPVQAALTDIYGDIFDFSKGALRLLRNKKGEIQSSLKLWGLAIWKTFQDKLGPVVDKFERHLDIFEQRATACDRRRQKIMNTFHANHAAASERGMATITLGITQGFQGLQTTVQALVEMQQHDYERQRKREEIEEYRVEREALANKRLAISKWLPSTDWRNDYEEICGKHLEGTGGWLLQDQKYKAWKSQLTSGLLWINGKPGCGKSFLSAITISDVDLRRDHDIGVAYVYCKTGKSKASNYLVLICTLLKQLCLQSSDVDHIYEDIVDRQNTGQAPGVTHIQTKLNSILSDFNQVYLVVDGLDECEQHEEFGAFLRNMIRTSTSTVRIAVFSRPNYVSFQDAFKDYEHLQVDSGKNEEDIETYISNIVTLDNIPVGRNTVILEKVKETLLSKSQGMFLWVELLVKTLKKQSTANQILSTLDSVPEKLDDLYGLCLQRIWDQDSGQSHFYRDAAYKILLWIINAKRPLTLAEMVEITAMNSETRHLDDGDKMDQHRLVEICADLVRLDNEGCLVIIHSSLRDYLLSATPAEPSQPFTAFRQLQSIAQVTLLRTCLTYILREEFDCGPTATVEELGLLQEQHPFLRYAGAHWASHLPETGDDGGNDIKNLITELVDSQSHRELCMQYFLLDWESGFTSLKGRSTPLHFISMFGLYNIAKVQPQIFSQRNKFDGFRALPLDYALMAQHKTMIVLLLDMPQDPSLPSPTDNGRMSPLHLAAARDWPDIIDTLLAQGYDPEIRTEDKATPLLRALSVGSLASVDRLLAANVDVNAEDKYGITALMLACVLSDETVVRKLIKAGADVKASDKDGETALHYATESKSLCIVDLLLAHGADPNHKAPGTGGMTPLHYAADHDAAEIAELLHKRGALIDIRYDGGYSALHLAASQGCLKTVKYLVQEDAPIDGTDDEGSIALMYAVQNGHLDVLEHLLACKSTNPDAQNRSGDTPLHFAAFYGQIDAAKLLLTQKINVNIQNMKNETPFLDSIENHKEIAVLLLKNGADPKVRGVLDSPALHYAAHFGHESLIGPMLAAGADPEAVNDYQDTALHFACYGGHIRFVKELLSRCPQIDINKLNKGRSTPLTQASRKGHVDVISFLVSMNALRIPDASGNYPFHLATNGGYVKAMEILKTQDNVSLPGFKGRTALHMASSVGHLDAVKFLVDSGAEVNSRDDDSVTPLFVALRQRHYEIANWLLSKDPKAITADRFGNTPLHIAVALGNFDFVQKLLKAGCDGLATDLWGYTPFYRAVVTNNMTLVELLSECGFDGSKLRSKIGNVPIFAASEYCDTSMLERLVKAGADPLAIEDATGHTALHYASFSGNTGVVDFLLEAGVDPHHLDRHNWSALMDGSRYGNAEFVETMLSSKVDPESVETYTGMTALLYAAAYRMTLTCRLLIDAGANPNHRDHLGRTAFDLATGHEPTLAVLQRGGNVPKKISLEDQRLEYALNSIRRTIGILSSLDDLSSLQEELDRLVLIHYLGTSLVFLSGPSMLEEYAALCFAETQFKPDTAILGFTCDCNMCRTHVSDEYYVCKTCFATSLCPSCHDAYTGESGSSDLTLEAFKAIEALEKEVHLVRRVSFRGYALGERFVVLALSYFQLMTEWVDKKLEAYEEWQKKYVAQVRLDNYKKPGYEFLKLVKEARAILLDNDNDGVAMATDSVESLLADIRKRRLALDRDVRPQTDFQDWICEGHEFLKVSKEAWTKAKAAGHVNEMNNRLTIDWLTSLLQQLPQPDDSKTAQTSDSSGLNGETEPVHARIPFTMAIKAGKTSADATLALRPKLRKRATFNTNWNHNSYTAAPLGDGHLTSIPSTLTMLRAATFPLQSLDPHFRGSKTTAMRSKTINIPRVNSIPTHSMPRSMTIASQQLAQDIAAPVKITERVLEESPLNSPEIERSDDPMDNAPSCADDKSENGFKISQDIVVIIFDEDDPTVVENTKTWTWRYEDEDTEQTTIYSVTLRFDSTHIGNVLFIFAMTLADLIDDGFPVQYFHRQLLEEYIERLITDSHGEADSDTMAGAQEGRDGVDTNNTEAVADLSSPTSLRLTSTNETNETISTNDGQESASPAQ